MGIVAVALLGAFVAGTDSSAGERAALPGRQVKVAAIAIGFGGNHDKKLRLAIEHLETAGAQGVDIACLPEEFSGTTAETIPGPTTNAVAELARKYHMYVVCPIREQAADGQQYNTAVLLDRTGKVQGRYRKVFVFWGEGLNVSRDGVPVFDTDFGRIAMLTCFDANFDEVWQEAERKGAEIVFWPSAYGGGMPLNGYAMIHNYNVVAVGCGNIIDIFGKTVENVREAATAAVHRHARPRPDAGPRQLQQAEGRQAPQGAPGRDRPGTVSRHGRLVRAALGEARRSRPRPVQAVPDRDASGVPPAQPRRRSTRLGRRARRSECSTWRGATRSYLRQTQANEP